MEKTLYIYHQKSLNKIHCHILVKGFSVTCLSILPGLIQIQTPEQDVSTTGTFALTSTDSFAPWKWLGSPKIWAAVRGCLSLWTECVESLQHLSLTMRRFKQMHECSVLALKQHLSSCEDLVVYYFIPCLTSAVLW